MKNTSNTMFKIGKIINIILIPLCALLVILGLILAIMGFLAAVVAERDGGVDPGDAASLAGSGLFLIFYFLFLLVFSIVSLIVCGKKHTEIENGSNEIAPRVFLIVFGALGDNIFYILAGIFSLIARSQEANNNTVVENKTEAAPAKEVVEAEVVKDEPKAVEAAPVEETKEETATETEDKAE